MTIRIALTSDTHYGHCRKQDLSEMFCRMAAETPDVIVHAGDWAGTHPFSISVYHTMDALRKYLPTATVLAVRGNHDLWIHDRNDLTRTRWREEEIRGRLAGKMLDVIWLDEYTGGYLHEDSGTQIVGTMGWYAVADPGTNDARWFPRGTNLHREILSSEQDRWDAICAATRRTTHPDRVIVVTHFPIVYPGDELIRKHGGSDVWVEHLESCLGGPALAYLNGHYHQSWKGEMDRERRPRYESGSDYGRPNFIMVEV